MSDDEDELAQSLRACARQLKALCGQLGLDEDELLHADSEDEQLAYGSGEEEGGSAAAMAEACMHMLASIESASSLKECDLQTGDDGHGNRDELQPQVHYKSLEAFVMSEEEKPALPASEALLDEMNALSIELGTFASLLVAAGESSDESEGETLAPIINEQDLLPPPHDLPEAADEGDLVCDEIDVATCVHTASSQSNHPLCKLLLRQRPPSISPLSTYQTFLRAHPPKSTNPRKPKKNPHPKTRTKQVREILGSPTLWEEYQSKSFQQHISRQQQARHVARQESLEAERAAAAHFKRAKFALKESGSRPEKADSVRPAVRSAAVHDTTYLRRFCRDRPRSQSSQKLQQPPFSPVMNGLLCGVYLYGKRRLGLAYFTCTSLAQLREGVCQRFGVSTVLNFYRERVVNTNSDHPSPAAGRKRPSMKSYQRITCFEHVRDGDRICTTRDSYEDMAILCEWIKQRQQRIHHMQQPNEPPKPPSHPVQPRKTRKNSPRSTATDENPSIWDANGRCMAVKKQLIV